MNDIVRDDAKKKLYVATDFGVVRGNNDGRADWAAAYQLFPGAVAYVIRNLTFTGRPALAARDDSLHGTVNSVLLWDELSAFQRGLVIVSAFVLALW